MSGKDRLRRDDDRCRRHGALDAVLADAARHDAVIVTLVHLNGPPGVGKSTIASALVAMRPLALGIEIDTLRTWIGQWETEESSKGLAREIAYAMASAHLERGRDVVIPQLDIRLEVIKRLRTIAEGQGGRFVEVILTSSHGEMARRVGQPTSFGGAHPRNLFTPEELAAQIKHYATELERLRDEWPAALSVDVSNLSPAESLTAVVAAIQW